jgi:hypothetical protein
VWLIAELVQRDPDAAGTVADEVGSADATAAAEASAVDDFTDASERVEPPATR